MLGQTVPDTPWASIYAWERQMNKTGCEFSITAVYRVDTDLYIQKHSVLVFRIPSISK